MKNPRVYFLGFNHQQGFAKISTSEIRGFLAPGQAFEQFCLNIQIKGLITEARRLNQVHQVRYLTTSNCQKNRLSLVDSALLYFCSTEGRAKTPQNYLLLSLQALDFIQVINRTVIAFSYDLDVRSCPFAAGLFVRLKCRSYCAH